MKLFENLFDFEREATTGEAVFFKLFEVFVVSATLYLAWSWGAYILRISDVVLPLGLAQYIDVSFMFGNALPFINAGLISLLLFLGFFRISRYTYLVAFLLLHLQYAARYSLGEIPHSANMMGMTLLAIALAMLVFDDAIKRRRFALGFTYFFVGLGYTLAGISKLIGTGVHWSDGRHLWMWINEKGIDAFSKTGILDYNWLQSLSLEHYWVATLFLTFGVITELAAFLIWWKRFRTPVIIGVLGLHIGIYIVMNIMFYLSFIELLFLGFPWAVWIERSLQKSSSPLLNPVKKMSHKFA